MRVWVARPEPGASRTGELLAERGHDPLVAPVLVVRPTGTPVPDWPFDAVLLTSPQALAALGIADRAGLTGCPAFAVGTRTAQEAAAHGLHPVHEGPGDAAGLAHAVRARLKAGARILQIAGAERKAEPAASLEAAGFPIAVHIAYAAERLATLPAAVAEALPDLDAVLHYSRRSAATALDLARGAGLDGAFRRLRHYCLSDDVAVPLAAAGIVIHFVPARPREDDLLAGLR